MAYGLYNQVLNKGQKSPKANYAFRKKNLEEKKCLAKLGKKFPFPEIWRKYKKFGQAFSNFLTRFADGFQEPSSIL
jgi:hypothetical protein